MRYVIILIALVLSACAAHEPSMDSLIADQHAQEHYEMVVRSCEAQGKPVYIRRTGSRIKRKLDRWEMLSAACANIH